MTQSAGTPVSRMLMAFTCKTPPHDQLHLPRPRTGQRADPRQQHPLCRRPHLLRRPQLRGPRTRDGRRPEPRAALLLHQAGRRAGGIRRDDPLPARHQELPLRDGTGDRDRRAGVQGRARSRRRRDLGLCRRPGHDAPRPAVRGQGRRPALGHRQGLRTVGRHHRPWSRLPTRGPWTRAPSRWKSTAW